MNSDKKDYLVELSFLLSAFSVVYGISESAEFSVLLCVLLFLIALTPRIKVHLKKIKIDSTLGKIFILLISIILLIIIIIWTNNKKTKQSSSENDIVKIEKKVVSEKKVEKETKSEKLSQKELKNIIDDNNSFSENKTDNSNISKSVDYKKNADKTNEIINNRITKINELNKEFSQYKYVMIGFFDTIKERFNESYFETIDGSVLEKKNFNEEMELTRPRTKGNPRFSKFENSKNLYIDSDTKIKVITTGDFYIKPSNKKNCGQVWLKYSNIKIE